MTLHNIETKASVYIVYPDASHPVFLISYENFKFQEVMNHSSNTSFKLLVSFYSTVSAELVLSQQKNCFEQQYAWKNRTLIKKQE